MHEIYLAATVPIDFLPWLLWWRPWSTCLDPWRGQYFVVRKLEVMRVVVVYDSNHIFQLKRSCSPPPILDFCLYLGSINYWSFTLTYSLNMYYLPSIEHFRYLPAAMKWHSACSLFRLPQMDTFPDMCINKFMWFLSLETIVGDLKITIDGTVVCCPTKVEIECRKMRWRNVSISLSCREDITMPIHDQPFHPCLNAITKPCKSSV